VTAVVELPDSSEEYEDSMDINPAAAASAAAHIAEFASASAGVLEAGASEGSHLRGVELPELAHLGVHSGHLSALFVRDVPQPLQVGKRG